MLQRTAVTHHALDRVGRHRTGEPFAGCLLTRNDRDRGQLTRHLVIDVQGQHRLAAGGSLVDVRGMTLLP